MWVAASNHGAAAPVCSGAPAAPAPCHDSRGPNHGNRSITARCSAVVAGARLRDGIEVSRGRFPTEVTRSDRAFGNRTEESTHMESKHTLLTRGLALLGGLTMALVSISAPPSS